MGEKNMRKQVVHISIHQTSKVVAALHTVMIATLFILPNALALMYNRHFISGLLLLLLLPLVLWARLEGCYGIACWFYNLVVPFTGGIEVDVDNVTSPESLIMTTKNPLSGEDVSQL